MNFISYAQNFEDVMLWRALKHVEKGFYIDVGAWSPKIDSVTRHFYENGWTGINIEPILDFYSLYESDRPRDINIRVAVGDRTGSLIINSISNTGLSTAIDEFALLHEAAGWTRNQQEVDLTTLKLLCSKHVKTQQDIHFLKVDVEGFEAAVLRGNDWIAHRPWVVVVEATLPQSQTDSYEDWEPILLNATYTFAYADGLNRFYVANEHSELLAAFKYPPNFFDGFLLSSQHEAETMAAQAEAKAAQAETRAAQAEAKAAQAETRAAQAEAKAAQAETMAAQAETMAAQAETMAAQAETRAAQAEVLSAHHLAQLQSVYASKSWRVTSPLRWTFTQARRLRAEGPRSRIKAFIKKALRKTNKELLLMPALHQHVIHCSRKLGLHDKLKSLLYKVHEQPQHGFPSAQDIVNLPTDLRSLSPRARQIYGDLKQVIENHQKEGQ